MTITQKIELVLGSDQFKKEFFDTKYFMEKFRYYFKKENTDSGVKGVFYNYAVKKKLIEVKDDQKNYIYRNPFFVDNKNPF